MNLIQIIGTFILILLCTSCVKELCDDDQKITIPFQDYNGNLKLNGYYWNLAQENSHDFNHIVFLSKNGTMYNMRTGLSQDELIELYENSGFNQEYKYKWGRFVSNSNNELTLQGWMVDMCKKRTFQFTGTVLNDTTFILTNYLLEDESQSIQREYNFVEFHLKPDSLNGFVN